MRSVPLTFEAFGLPVTRAELAVEALPALQTLSSLNPADLPNIDAVDGYYLPSAVLGDEATNGASPAALPPAPTGFFWLERGRFPRYFLDLTQSYDDFLASKSGKTRSTLKRKLRKFEKLSDGNIDWRLYRSPEEMRSFHEIAVVLARRTYQAKLYDAALPEDPGFVSEMEQRAETGQVAGFLLFLKGEPVAYLYTPFEDGRVIYGFLGFDSAHRDLSPGTVLQLLAMQWCFERDELTVFDFTEGEGSHKALFSTDMKLCADLLLLRRTSRLLFLAKAFRSSRSLSQGSVALLDRMGLKARIKGWLRKSS